VTLPGGTHVSRPTGLSNITFHHRGAHEVSCDYAGLKVATGGPDTFRVVLFEVPNRAVSHFQKQWQKVSERIGAAYATYNTGIRDRGQQLQQERRERKQAEAAQVEAAAKQRAAELRSQAQAHTDGLLRDAGMGGDFKSGAQTDGQVDWFIAADRDGRGLVAAGSEVWQGSFTGAKARILSGKERGLDLELPDSAYEREHLKKRRMRIMARANDEAIQEWSDRVAILGAQATVS